MSVSKLGRFFDSRSGDLPFLNRPWEPGIWWLVMGMLKWNIFIQLIVDGGAIHFGVLLEPEANLRLKSFATLVPGPLRIAVARCEDISSECDVALIAAAIGNGQAQLLLDPTG
jgi:hypothetical protein